MQFWLWCTFYTNNHPNNSHSAKWCRKMEILCNWKWYSPFNFKLCSYLINLIYTDNPIHIHYVKSWMASWFEKSNQRKLYQKLHHFHRYNFYPKSSFSIKCGFKYQIICFSVEIACIKGCFLSLSPYLIWIQSENQKWSLYCDNKNWRRKIYWPDRENIYHGEK